MKAKEARKEETRKMVAEQIQREEIEAQSTANQVSCIYSYILVCSFDLTLNCDIMLCPHAFLVFLPISLTCAQLHIL
jgi:hypothetical protein